MDNRPIGIFDSGVGGLTAVRALRALLPAEDVIYFGDSGRMPYGGRSRVELLHMALQDAAFLTGKNVKALMAACGTTDSNVMEELKARVDVPVFGVVRPAAEAAAATTRSGRVGVIATAATARSDAYGRALLEAEPTLHVVTRGCPLLASLAEQGRVGAEDPVLLAALREYLDAIAAEEVDTLLLGCTHYPLVSAAIAAVIGEQVRQIDSGAEGAAVLAAWLRKNGMLREDSRAGRVTYYTSGSEKTFASVAGIFLGGPVAENVHSVEPFPL